MEEREVLYKKINKRVDMMIDEGFIEEVESLLEKGYSAKLKSMLSIGYRHINEFLSGRISKIEAIETMKRDTRRYAKRQMTWFKKDAEIIWVRLPEILSLKNNIERFLED